MPGTGPPGVSWDKRRARELSLFPKLAVAPWPAALVRLGSRGREGFREDKPARDVMREWPSHKGD